MTTIAQINRSYLHACRKAHCIQLIYKTYIYNNPVSILMPVSIQADSASGYKFKTIISSAVNYWTRNSIFLHSNTNIFNQHWRTTALDFTFYLCVSSFISQKQLGLWHFIVLLLCLPSFLLASKSLQITTGDIQTNKHGVHPAENSYSHFSQLKSLLL